MEVEPTEEADATTEPEAAAATIEPEAAETTVAMDADTDAAGVEGSGAVGACVDAATDVNALLRMLAPTDTDARLSVSSLQGFGLVTLRGVSGCGEPSEGWAGAASSASPSPGS